MGRSYQRQTNRSFGRSKSKKSTSTTTKKTPKFMKEDMERFRYTAGEPDTWSKGRNIFLALLLVFALGVFLYLHSV